MVLLHGNWGIKSNNTKVGIAQVLNRLTYTSTLSHLRRVNTPTEKTGKLVAPKKLHNTQWGIICPTETPEGGSVGLVKNLAVMTHITNESSADPIYKILQDSPYTIPVNLDDVTQNFKMTKVFVNGMIDYLCTNVKELYGYLVSQKRKGLINIFTSISFNSDLNEINVYTDGGRCCRPLYIMDNGGLRITREELQKVQSKNYNWFNLMIGSLNQGYRNE